MRVGRRFSPRLFSYIFFAVLHQSLWSATASAEKEERRAGESGWGNCLSGNHAKRCGSIEYQIEALRRLPSTRGANYPARSFQQRIILRLDLFVFLPQFAFSRLGLFRTVQWSDIECRAY